MSSLGEELPREIARVRKVRDIYVGMRSTPGVMVEPAIMLMDAAIDGAIAAISSGDVLEMIRQYNSLKGFNI